MSRKEEVFMARRLLSAGVALLGLAMLTGAAYAANQTSPALTAARITGSVNAEPVAKLTPEERRVVSLAAGRILQHTARARLAIADQHNDEATAQIDKGLTLVRIIEHAMPKQKVTAEIQSGDIRYKDENQVTPALVPIYDELDYVDVMTPVMRAKKKGTPNAGSKSKGKVADSSEPPSVIEASTELEHTTTQLDVLYAKEMLTLAKKELGEGKTEKADDALWGIQANGVILEFDEASVPLKRAADNLKLAEFEMREGWTNDAKIALQASSDALKEYEKLTGEYRSKEVRTLHQEIDQLIKSLDTNHTEGDMAKARKKLSGWWDRVTEWFRK